MKTQLRCILRCNTEKDITFGFSFSTVIKALQPFMFTACTRISARSRYLSIPRCPLRIRVCAAARSNHWISPSPIISARFWEAPLRVWATCWNLFSEIRVLLHDTRIISSAYTHTFECCLLLDRFSHVDRNWAKDKRHRRHWDCSLPHLPRWAEESTALKTIDYSSHNPRATSWLCFKLFKGTATHVYDRLSWYGP